MKIITLIWMGAAVLAGQSAPSKTETLSAQQRAKIEAHQTKKVPAPARKAAAPRSAASQAPAIPPGATQMEPNLYRSTDAQGRTWFYRQTPFGVSKWEETPSPQAATEPPAATKTEAPVRVSDLGDRVQFERSTPFGATKWIRNKTELTSEEKALLAHDGQPAPPQLGDKTAEKQ